MNSSVQPPDPANRAVARGRTLIIGDIHGCSLELRDLIDSAGLGADDRVIALGDVVDRGPDSAGVLDFFRTTAHASSLMGNHERKHVNSFRSGAGGALSQQLVREEMGGRYPGAVALMETFVPWIELPDAVLVHGFWEPGVALRAQKPEVIIGTLSGEKHLSKNYRAPWYDLYDGRKPLIVGHHDYLHTGAPLIHKDRVFGLDTGCCYGGRLTGLLLPEWRIVSVPGRANYWRNTTDRLARTQSGAVPAGWSAQEEALLDQILEMASRRMAEVCSGLRAADAGFDSLPRHEQNRRFAEFVRGDALAPVLFRLRDGRGGREAMRQFFRTPSWIAAVLADAHPGGSEDSP